jgi:hypothetical protein
MVSSTPNVPEVAKISPATAAIKIARPDIMLVNNDSLPIELMSDLIFEDIGGQEIINIVRNDMVNGQNVIYKPVKNLSQINSQYNSYNIINLENTSDSYFKNFPIKFETHVPQVGTGPAPEYPIVYLDETNGNLIINVVNMAADEQVEVQIVARGSMLNDTIYEG